MPTLQKLFIKDHLLYKDFTWNLTEDRLCTIRGKNLDRDEESGNATGKSTLPATIGTILYDNAPSSFKKKSSKEVLTPKSDMTLYVANRRGEYAIRSFMQKNAQKFQILHGETDLTLKNIADIRNEISGIFPMPEDCFYSVVYLNNVRPPVLLTGKPLDRLKFFETVFDQSIYSELRALWSSNLSDISKKTSSFKTLKEEFANLQDVEEVPQSKLKTLKAEHKVLKQKTQRNQASVNKLIAYVSIQEEIKNIQSSKVLTDEMKKTEENLKSLDSKVRKYTERLQENQQAKDSMQERKSLKKRIGKLGKFKDSQTLRKELKEASTKTSKIEVLIERFEEWEGKLDRYKKLKEIRPKKPSEKSFSELQKEFAKAEYIVDSLSDLKSAKTCPTCHQPISKECVKELAVAKKKMKSLNAILTDYELYNEFKEIEENLPKVLLKTTHATAKEEYKKAEAVENAIQSALDSSVEREALEAQLKALPKTEYDEKITEKGLSSLLAQRDAAHDKLNQLQSDIRLMLKLESLHVDLPLKEAKKQLASKQKWLDKTANRLEEISEALEDLMRKDAQYQVTKKRADEIASKMQSLKKDINKKEVYEELKRACSYKGLMILETQDLAGLYAQKLNALAKDYFLEDVSFEIDVDVNKFNFIAHRSGQVGDIRYFSGSERGQFIPLSALALTSLMPNDARCNVMIMDELEGGMSPPEMEVFGNEFIPNVSRSIENTIVITPKPPEIFMVKGAREKLLVRKDKQTKWAE